MAAMKSSEILWGMAPSTYPFALQECVEMRGGRSLPPTRLDTPSKFAHVLLQTF